MWFKRESRQWLTDPKRRHKVPVSGLPGNRSEWQIRWRLLGAPLLIFSLAVMAVICGAQQLLWYMPLTSGQIYYVTVAGAACLICVLWVGFRSRQEIFPSLTLNTALLVGSSILMTSVFCGDLVMGLVHSTVTVRDVDDVHDWTKLRTVKIENIRLDVHQANQQIKQFKTKRGRDAVHVAFDVNMNQSGSVRMRIDNLTTWQKFDSFEQKEAAFGQFARAVEYEFKHIRIEDIEHFVVYDAMHNPERRLGYTVLTPVFAQHNDFDSHNIWRGLLKSSWVWVYLLLVCFGRFDRVSYWLWHDQYIAKVV